MKYNIRKGKFGPSGLQFGLHTGRVNQTYKVRFDSSCLYDPKLDWERDWNKLVGWSYSNLPYYYEKEEKWQAPHHRDSVRLVWRPNITATAIELAYYYYQDGVRYIVEICEVPVDKDLLLSIILKKERAIIVVICKEINLSIVKPVTMSKAFKAIWSYKLYPYFGGTYPAWNDLLLEVTET